MLRSLLILLLALSQVACISTRSIRFSTDDTLLGVEEREDGSTVTWRLNGGRSGTPSVQKTVTETRAIARLGVVGRPIGKLRAERYGIDSWRGVWLDSVLRGSAADEAGLRGGDVLIELNGVDLSSPEQMSQVIEQTLTPGTSAEVLILRFDGEGDGQTGREVVLTVVPDAREVVDSSTDAIALTTSKVVQNLTGLRVALVPADLAVDAMGTEGAVVLVSGVLPGSPAYLAGLRPGDRVVEVDGQPIESIAPLVAAILARADEKGLSVSTDERRGLSVARAAQGPVALRVDGPLGDHTTSIDVSGNLDEEGEINIPILFECDSDISSTRWSLLDFIFQFGANYRGYYLESKTRKPARSTFFSMLPFGFFEVERSPRRSRYCVLWFIEWETEH